MVKALILSLAVPLIATDLAVPLFDESFINLRVRSHDNNLVMSSRIKLFEHDNINLGTIWKYEYSVFDDNKKPYLAKENFTFYIKMRF
jgi:hypothetical protein